MTQKHLAVVLDERLTFEEHFKMIISKPAIFLDHFPTLPICLN